MTTKWEYEIVDLRRAVAQENKDLLSALGEHGWEAVGIAASGAGQTVLLKRPVATKKQPR